MKILKKFSKNTLKCTVYVENWCFNFPNWLVENALLFNGAIISTIYLSYFCYQKLMKIYIFIILHIGILKKNLVFVVKKWKKCEKIFNKKKYKYDHMNFGIYFRKFVFLRNFTEFSLWKFVSTNFFFWWKSLLSNFFCRKFFFSQKYFCEDFFTIFSRIYFVFDVCEIMYLAKFFIRNFAYCEFFRFAILVYRKKIVNFFCDFCFSDEREYQIWKCFFSEKK